MKLPTSTGYSFETFRRIGTWQLQQLEASEPSCFNGEVAIRKYRITVEEVDEPKAVLEQRLRKLWRECDNHHHWAPLQAVAAKLGITLLHDERRKPNE